MIEEPGRINISVILIAHPVARFQRAKVIPLHVRHNAFEASCQVRLESLGSSRWRGAVARDSSHA